MDFGKIMHKKLEALLILEVVDKVLAEMPKMQNFYYLNDNWKENAKTFLEKYSNKKGLGFSNLMQGLEKLATMGNLLTNKDVYTAFGFKDNFNFNQNFRPFLEKEQIIVPVRQKDREKFQQTQVDLPQVPDEDDEFTVFDAPESDLTQGIDIEHELKRIKKDPKVSKLTIHKVKEIPVTAIPETVVDAKIQQKTEYTISLFKFLKPYIEDKYSQKIQDTIYLKRGGYYWGNISSNPNTHNLKDLFPEYKDFLSYFKKHLDKFSEYKQTPMFLFKTPGSTWERSAYMQNINSVTDGAELTYGKPTTSFYVTVS